PRSEGARRRLVSASHPGRRGPPGVSFYGIRRERPLRQHLPQEFQNVSCPRPNRANRTIVMASKRNIRWENKPSGERTLYIDNGQAMQAWEQGLMEFSADLLVSYGSRFAEAGLGFGFSALRISGGTGVKSHTVVELHKDVVRQFSSRHP